MFFWGKGYSFEGIFKILDNNIYKALAWKLCSLKAWEFLWCCSLILFPCLATFFSCASSSSSSSVSSEFRCGQVCWDRDATSVNIIRRSSFKNLDSMSRTWDKCNNCNDDVLSESPVSTTSLMMMTSCQRTFAPRVTTTGCIVVLIFHSTRMDQQSAVSVWRRQDTSKDASTGTRSLCSFSMFFKIYFQYYTKCTTGPTNPFHGAISFDNIGLAWVAIFLVISLEGWTDVMYFVQDSHSFWNWIYFVCLIVVIFKDF